MHCQAQERKFDLYDLTEGDLVKIYKGLKGQPNTEMLLHSFRAALGYDPTKDENHVDLVNPHLS